jgi:nucleoid-associated protein YgaU
VGKSALGPERVILSLALLLPLAIVLVGLAELQGLNLTLPTRVLAEAESDTTLPSHRPAASNPAPPPTLAAPTATPQPTATPVPPTPVPQPTTAHPAGQRTYVVQHGDELKNIAAAYGVSIWKIIDSNNIPNPDSLRVGQVLQIPDN